MKTLKWLPVFIGFMSLSLFSCSVNDEITSEDETEILSTDLSNQDDDPETEETGG